MQTLPKIDAVIDWLYVISYLDWQNQTPWKVAEQKIPSGRSISTRYALNTTLTYRGLWIKEILHQLDTIGNYEIYTANIEIIVG